MNQQISKEIASAIDASQNIGVALITARDHIESLERIIEDRLVDIEDRDKIIATQEQEIADMKKEMSVYIQQLIDGEHWEEEKKKEVAEKDTRIEELESEVATLLEEINKK